MKTVKEARWRSRPGEGLQRAGEVFDQVERFLMLYLNLPNTVAVETESVELNRGHKLFLRASALAGRSLRSSASGGSAFVAKYEAPPGLRQC